MNEPTPSATRPGACSLAIDTSRMKKVRISVIMSPNETM